MATRTGKRIVEMVWRTPRRKACSRPSFFRQRRHLRRSPAAADQRRHHLIAMAGAGACRSDLERFDAISRKTP